jgi:hypothetical protein
MGGGRGVTLSTRIIAAHHHHQQQQHHHDIIMQLWKKASGQINVRRAVCLPVVHPHVILTPLPRLRETHVQFMNGSNFSKKSISCCW